MVQMPERPQKAHAEARSEQSAGGRRVLRMSHRTLTNRPREQILKHLNARLFTMLKSDVIERIRRIFLQVRPHVSIRQATDLLGWTRERMTAAIAAGEVVLNSTPLGKWIGREELIAKGLEAWRST